MCADLSDATAYFEQVASSAAYPNGASSPSVAGIDVHVFEGWPRQIQLDADIAAGKAQVSIYPIRSPGSGIVAAQRLPRQQTIIAPVHGLAATVANNTISVAGTPAAGEFLTVTVDRKNSYSRPGASVAIILAAIAADALALYPDVHVAGSTISFPSAHSLSARSGASGVAGVVTHWQRQSVTVTIWAPSPAARNALAKAIDVALKANLRVTLGDGSQAIIRYSTTVVDDGLINDGVYRRDLIFDAEFATVEEFAVTEITSVGFALDVGPSLIGHVANKSISSEGN